MGFSEISNETGSRDKLKSMFINFLHFPNFQLKITERVFNFAESWEILLSVLIAKLFWRLVEEEVEVEVEVVMMLCQVKADFCQFFPLTPLHPMMEHGEFCVETVR